MRRRAGGAGWKERGGDTRHALSEQIAENSEGVKVALATRAEQCRQHFLGLRAEPRAIAARDFRFTTAGRSAELSVRIFCTFLREFSSGLPAF
jgi:hypothetical protein